jgi:hypothetical protein
MWEFVGLPGLSMVKKSHYGSDRGRRGKPLSERPGGLLVAESTWGQLISESREQTDNHKYSLLLKVSLEATDLDISFQSLWHLIYFLFSLNKITLFNIKSS